MELKDFILIWSATFIVTCIQIIFIWKHFKKTIDKPEFAGIRDVYEHITENSPSVKKFKKHLFNPYIYFLYAVILFIISPLLLPLYISDWVKKIFKIKTKLDKEAEKETAAIEESKNWLENEGVYADEEPIILPKLHHPDMEWKAEEYDCIQMYLDDINAPTHNDTGDKYSVIGRIKEFVKFNKL